MALSRTLSVSSLKGKHILVTGGPTPVCLDNVREYKQVYRAIGDRNSDGLICKRANVHLVHGQGSYVPPAVIIPHEVVTDYDEYKEAVDHYLEQNEVVAGIFSAAVADYKPAERMPGKVASGKTSWEIALTPTAKVIDHVHEKFPALCMVTFKYQENMSHEQLMTIAKERLNRGYPMVVMNRGEEKSASGRASCLLGDRCG